MESLRFAPSMTQPMGIPNRSVAIDHFHPILARSVGLGPVPSPPHGALCRLPSTATSDRSRGDDLVVAGDGFFDELVEHPGGQPLDRKSTRLNSSHANISYAVFCLKKTI